jgi:fatty acid desaturase
MLMQDHLTRDDSERLARRRRGRNWAMLIALVALCVLFYAITVVKMSHQ